jgi:hypothetical protein
LTTSACRRFASALLLGRFHPKNYLLFQQLRFPLPFPVTLARLVRLSKNKSDQLRPALNNFRIWRRVMNTLNRTFAFALVASLAAVTFTATPALADTKMLLVSPGTDPGFAPVPHLPKFGFSSFSMNGVGERVTQVRWGGLASRFGLERGDIILSMNGYRLTYHGSWNDALYQAMYQGGWVRLRIRDVRTGHIVQRQMFVGDGGGVGPITPHFHNGQPSGPITLKSQIGPHSDNPSPKLNKKIAKLFD